jgi:RHS repeat-associated protein
MAVVMVVSLLTVAALPERAVAAPAKPVCPASRADEASALLTARWCGGKVEVTGDMTETIQVWANPDGSLTSEVHSGPVRIRQNGVWVPVDLTLRRNVDGSVAPKAHPAGLRLSGPAGAGVHDLVSVGSGDDAVTVGWSGVLPEPVLAGTKATYPDVRPGVDLVIEATRTGYEESFVVKDRAGLAQVGSLTLPMRSKNLTPKADGRGGLSVRDRRGAESVRMTAPVMFDAAVGANSLEHLHRGGIALSMVAKGGGSTDVVLTPDAKFLADASLQFPVTIDPATVYASFDTFVQTDYTTDQSAATELKLGYSDDGGSFTARSFLSWPSSAFAGAHINSATVYLWEWHSWSCTPASWEVWLSGAVSTSTRWTAQPAWMTKYGTSTQTKGASSSCNDGWVSAPATGVFQAGADNSWSTTTMGLKATNESDHNSWKRFNSSDAASGDPYVVVNYNAKPVVMSRSTAPATPCAGGASRPYLNTKTPTLSAQIVDPEGSPVSATFEWWAVGGGAPIGSTTVGPQASGSTFTATVPSGAYGEGGPYSWRVRGSDGSLTGNWSDWCEYTIDTTEPTAAPGVSSTTWPANTWTGGVPTYTFATASQTYVNGTSMLALTGDSGAVDVALPFTFTFFGRTYNDVWALVDGQIDMPNDDAYIGPFLDNLTVDASASVRTATTGTAPNRQFVIDWHNVYRNAEPTVRFNLEAILGENGTITYNYGSLSTDGSKGATADVGLKDINGFYVWYSNQWASLASGTAIVFTPTMQAVSGYTTTTATTTYTPATTTLALTGDDAYTSLTAPFPVSLYGVSASTLYVDTNGQVSIRDNGGPYAALTQIPNVDWPNGDIYVFGDDLNVDASASVRTATTGTAPNRQFTIEWHNVTLAYDDSQRFDAEVIFTEGSGDIVMNYQNLGANSEKGAGAVVGLEDPHGFLATQYLYHQPNLANNTEIIYHPLAAVPFAGANTTGIFTFTPNGISDVASYQYGLDTNPPTTVVNAASIGGNATVSITPTTDGTHTLYVRSQDRAGNQSPITSYVVNVGYGGLSSPKPGDLSAGTVALTTSAGPYATGVTYQWRRADTDTWSNVPTADVTIASGGGSIASWPYWPSSGPLPTINWNVATTVNTAEAGPDALDGPLQVRAVFAGAVSGISVPVKFSLDRNQASAASSSVGPGDVNLLTGNLTLSDTDMSVDSYGSDLTVTRTFNTRQPAKTDAANMFGPGWVSGVAVSDASAPYTNLTVTGSLVQVGLPDGDTLGFTEATSGSSGKTYESEMGFEQLALTYTTSGDTYTLKDLDGNTVTFTHITGAASTVYNPTAVTTPGSGQTTSVSWQKVTVGGVDLVRPTQVLAPVPTGVTCSSLVKGCRALTFTYAAATTATGTSSSQWGDYTGRVSQISFTAWNPDASPAAMATIVMARYSYDSNGRLRAAWDPRLDYTDTGGTHHLADSYDYDTDGIITAINPAGGQQPWQLSYTTIPGDAGKGRLAQVTRSALSAGSANTTVVYNVPVSGTGAPYDLSAGQTTRWGQAAAPVAATAVYPATQVPDGIQSTGTMPSSYERATITYTDANGRQVNTVAPGGYTTATWYDSYGNTVRTLTAANRKRALDASATDTASQEAAIAYRESSISNYSPDGLELRDTFGPEHDVALSTGLLVRGRDHTVDTYDQGAPSTGGPFHLATTSVTTVSYVNNNGVLSDADGRTTTTGYDWTLRKPTISTVDPTGLALATRTGYDSTTGLVTSATTPAGGTTTNTPATTQTVYYRAATGSGYSECDSHAEWANLVCRTQPGGQAASGPEIPATVTTYNIDNQPRVTTEKTSGGTLRTTTVTYDGAGRVSTTAITGASGTGTTLPTQRKLYDQATGQLTHIQSLDASNNVTADTIQAYDTLGRITSYTDADSNVTTTSYDIAGRTATTNDSKAIRTYTYDGGTERRGLPTQIADGQAGAFTNGTYDPDGKLTSETWPNGIIITNTFDEAGTQRSIIYTLPGCGTSDCTLYSQQIDQTAQGQTADQTSTLSAQNYHYDANARLATVNDTVAGGCTTRTYTFNTATDRTGLTTYNPAGDSSCQTTTAASTISWTYDSADRINTTGYTYDTLARTTTVPAADTQNPSGGDLTTTYHVNDLVRSISQAGRTTTYTIDATNNRVRSWTDSDGTTTTTKTNHYNGSDDSPTWTDESGSTWTRPISGLGSMACIASTNSTTTDKDWQITNLHGDVIATIHNSDTGLTATSDTTEYGTQRNINNIAALRYGWLGAKQRAADTPSGIILMGARLYNPTTGRFLQTDPVPGGSCNAYDYACQSPADRFDLDGRCWWKCKVARRVTGTINRWQSGAIGWGVRTAISHSGGRCGRMSGLEVCRGGWLHLYGRGGTTLGDTYATSWDSGAVTPARLRHESRHRDLQWRRYGSFFAIMYLAQPSDPCHNRYERQAGWKDGGYYAC